MTRPVLRSLLLLLVLLASSLLLPCLAQGQVKWPLAYPANQDSTISKGANYIVICTKDSLDVALHKITQTLLKNGFVIDEVSKMGAIHRTITTQTSAIPRRFKPATAVLSYATVEVSNYQSLGDESIRETVITITGRCIKQSHAAPPYEGKKGGVRKRTRMRRTEHIGFRRGYRKAAFRQLAAVAQAYIGGQVRYGDDHKAAPLE